MTLLQMSYILEVDRCGSINRAAQNLFVSQSALSSAIAANLAKGMALEDAVRRAKEYISGALAAMLDLGHGRGPMNHLFDLKSAYMKEAE